MEILTNLRNSFRRITSFLTIKKVSSKAMFIAMGIVSTVWVLMRVIPKPSRINYPCVRASAPVMTSFIIYIISFTGAFAAFRSSKRNYSQSRYLTASLMLVVGLFASVVSFGVYNIKKASAAIVVDQSKFVANSPVGEPKGSIPGRVVWVWDPEATNENCTNAPNVWNDKADDDGYFLPKNNNQEVQDQMLDTAIMKLASAQSVADAWERLFTHHNVKKGLAKQGYTNGETIFIKVNQGTSSWTTNGNFEFADWVLKGGGSYGIAETAPTLMLSMLKQLIEDAGVPQENIVIADPRSHIFQHTYEYLSAVYPNVKYGDKTTGDMGRTLLTPEASASMYFSDKGKKLDYETDSYFTEMTEADYVINMGALKAHARAGVTLTAKNHFGSHTRSTAEHMHNGLVAKENDIVKNPNFGDYRVLVDIMGHEKLGGNTVLFLVDGLWGGPEATEKPVKWNSAPFNGDWPNSILISQDQVALESVCFDLLRYEFTNPEAIGKARPHMPAVTDYLMQAASPENWPTTVEGVAFAGYDPEGDGSFLKSLGVYEHWNDVTTKQYSKNLAKGRGIELISIPESLVESKQVNAPEAKTLPTIDGVADDDIWTKAEWNGIDYTWIDYGVEYPASDFTGKFKVVWSASTNLLYFLVEVTDDAFVGGYTPPNSGYPDYDIVEVFIDEDISGGFHLIDGEGSVWGTPRGNGENAFAYHLAPQGNLSDGATLTSVAAMDLGGTAAQNPTPVDYTSHVPHFAVKRTGNNYVWEFALKVHNDTYDSSDENASIETLFLGKEMGMTVAYCDNDNPSENPKKRDHFFGSVNVKEENYNDHWKDATDFGKIVLKPENTTPVNTAPVVIKTIADVALLKPETKEVVNDLNTIFNDYESNPMTFNATSSNENVTVNITGAKLSITGKNGFTGNSTITVEANDGNNTTKTFFTVSINNAPVASSYTGETKVVVPDQDVTLTSNLSSFFSDPDNDALTYTVTSSDNKVNASINGNKLIVNVGADYTGGATITVEASDGVQEASFDFVLEYVPSALNKNDITYSLNIYPNPVVGQQLNISFDAPDASDVNITIVSMQGRTILSKQYNNSSARFSKQINLSELPKGVYILKLDSKYYKGSKVFTK